MSRAYNGWPPQANPPQSIPQHFGPTPTDQLQQGIRLPPASSLLETQPEHTHAAPSQPPSIPVPPHQPFGNPPAVHYPQPPARGTYYNPEHNVQQHPRDHPPAPSPFHAPDPVSRDRVTDLRDPRQLEVAHEPQHYTTQPILPSQSTPHDDDPSQQQMGILQSTPNPPVFQRTHGSVIPNLLGAEKSEVLKNMKFHLSMRQQPKAARACGSGERDRRNIDPPPILQLHVDGFGLSPEDIDKYLRHEGYVVNCWIYDENGKTDASHMPSEYRYQRRLTGSVVSTPFFGKDDQGKEGCFFPFSDLSVRSLGRYRLKFQLCMIDTQAYGKAKSLPILSDIFSDVFDVYTAKEFPGINESSRLVRTLREQGCIIAIKKGNDKKKKTRGGDDMSDDDDEDEDEEFNRRAPRTKRKHRQLIDDEA